MGFGDIENLALQQAAEAERKRRQDEQQLALEEADLKRQMLKEKADEAGGPAAQLKALGTSRVSIDPAFAKSAAEDAFLNEQATRRFDRRAQALEDRKAKLAVPGPTATERAATMEAPLGRFANEDPLVATQETLTDRPGRLAAIDQTKENLLQDVSRGTAADRIYYREEPSGSLSFTNRPDVAAEPGYRRYNTDSGRTKDLGAPGGGLTVIGRGEPAGAADTKEALLRHLDALRGQTERTRLSPQELAKDLGEQQPAWDEKAANSDPTTISEDLNAAVASGMRPETAQYLQRRYQSFGQSSRDPDTGELNTEKWSNLLRQGRSPAPGEAAGRAQTGGQAIPEAEQAKADAIQSALQPPENAPGTTQSPSLAAESQAGGGTPQNPKEALLARLGLPAQRQAQDVGGGPLGYEIGGPFVPEGMQQIPEQLREATAGAALAGPRTGMPDLSALPENIRLVLEGLNYRAGGRESRAERQRRLAREAMRRAG